MKTPRTDRAVLRGYRFTRDHGVSEYVPAEDMATLERELVTMRRALKALSPFAEVGICRGPASETWIKAIKLRDTALALRGSKGCNPL